MIDRISVCFQLNDVRNVIHRLLPNALGKYSLLRFAYVLYEAMFLLSVIEPNSDRQPKQRVW